MNVITEQTFIKLNLRTFRLMIGGIVTGVLCMAGLYFGIKDAIKDLKTEMVLEIKDVKSTVSSNKTDLDNFKNNQSTFNSDITDFRRRAEKRFGWR